MLAGVAGVAAGGVHDRRPAAALARSCSRMANLISAVAFSAALTGDAGRLLAAMALANAAARIGSCDACRAERATADN